MYLKSCEVCAWHTFSQGSIWYKIHSEIFMLESHIRSCWSRSGPLRAEVTTQGPDMNNDESLWLTLKLRRGLKKELKHRWTVTCGGRPDQCGLHKSRRSWRNRIIPCASIGHLSPWCHKRAAIETPPKALTWWVAHTKDCHVKLVLVKTEQSFLLCFTKATSLVLCL